MLAKSWKKIGVAILIIACFANLVYKLVNKYSLSKEMIYSATYMNEVESQNDDNANTTNYIDTIKSYINPDTSEEEDQSSEENSSEEQNNEQENLDEQSSSSTDEYEIFE